MLFSGFGLLLLLLLDVEVVLAADTFFGSACGTIICENGGLCVTDRWTRSERCECAEGWEGESCQTKIAEYTEEVENDRTYSQPGTSTDESKCGTLTCENGGACVADPATGFERCACADGWGGDRCQTQIDPFNTDGNKISEGTYRDNRTKLTNECTARSCGDGRTCQSKDGKLLCMCPSGYSGSDCKTPDGLQAKELNATAGSISDLVSQILNATSPYNITFDDVTAIQSKPEFGCPGFYSICTHSCFQFIELANTLLDFHAAMKACIPSSSLNTGNSGRLAVLAQDSFNHFVNVSGALIGMKANASAITIVAGSAFDKDQWSWMETRGGNVVEASSVEWVPEGTDVVYSVYPCMFLSGGKLQNYRCTTSNGYICEYYQVESYVSPGADGLGDCATTQTHTQTPTKTRSPTPTVTKSPTPTETQSPTPTETRFPTPTETESPTSTETRFPTPTETESPTPTETESPTPTETESPTPTETESPTPTETESPTPTETESPTPTETESPTPTETESPTPTETESPTPTETESPTPTETESPTPTETESPTPTETESPTPTETESPTPTETESPTPTETESPTPTETESPTPTETESPTPTETESPTPTETESPTPTETESPTPTETNSPTPTEIKSLMRTQTMAPTPTETQSPLPTQSTASTLTETQSPIQSQPTSSTRPPTPISTETQSPTPSETQSPTPSETKSPTETQSATPTPTETQTSIPTESPTQTQTQSRIQTPTHTPSATPTLTQSQSETPQTDTTSCAGVSKPIVGPYEQVLTQEEAECNEVDGYFTKAACFFVGPNPAMTFEDAIKGCPTGSSIAHLYDMEGLMNLKLLQEFIKTKANNTDLWTGGRSFKPNSSFPSSMVPDLHWMKDALTKEVAISVSRQKLRSFFYENQWAVEDDLFLVIKSASRQAAWIPAPTNYKNVFCMKYTVMADFETIAGHYVDGVAMATRNDTESAWHCGVECRREHGCLQLNYHKSNQSCQLFPHKIYQGRAADDLPDGFSLKNSTEVDSFVRIL